MKITAPVILFWVILAAMVTAMATFDRLVRWLHATKRDEWLALGSPTGYFFTPDSASFWRSDTKKTQLAHRLIFVTPAWISDSASMRKALLVYRCSSVIGLGSILFMIYLLR